MRALLGYTRRKRGRLNALANHLGITMQGVLGWKKVPLARLEAVSAFTGLPKERLRPDLFKKGDANGGNMA